MPDLMQFALIVLPILLLISIIASGLSNRLGIPALLLFLVLGMLAGSEGVGGIYFDDYALAQFLGVVALALILFAGGLDTRWADVRPAAAEALTLSTLGVMLTAVILGALVHLLFGFPLLEAMLLGAIVSSTDAAAVLAVLRSKGVSLAGRLRPLLELESGSNDPMAVFLTVAIVSLLTDPGASLTTVLARLPLQMALGGLLGYLAGRAIPVLVNRLELGYDGLYPVLTLAAVLLTFGVTDRVGGNGFLAVYVAGLVAGNQDFLHRRSLLSFHDGLAWLMQIAMFLTLGLLVFPSRLIPVAGVGLGVTALLMLVARPLSVFLLLWPGRLRAREKLLLSWVGLRGAVPIILATYPLLAGVAGAEAIFNAVFFVVLLSVLLQGTTIPRIARWLGVDAPLELHRQYPIEYNPMAGLRSTLHEVPINERSPAAGRSIVELRLPAEFLIILVARGSEFIVPNGGTRLRPGDTLLALSEDAALNRACALLGCEGPVVPGTSTTDDASKTDSQVA